MESVLTLVLVLSKGPYQYLTGVSLSVLTLLYR